MGRLVAAVIVLLVTLLGLRVISSPLFQQNNASTPIQRDVVDQTDAVPQPRSTGVSSAIPPTEPSPLPTGSEDYTPPPPTTSPSPDSDKGQMW